MHNGTVAVVACTGMGKALASVGRHAALLLTDDMRPNDTVNVCLPCICGKQEDAINSIETHPVLVIDGCADTCAMKLVKRIDEANVIDHLKIWRVMAKHKGLKPETRANIGPAGIELAKNVAREASNAINRYISSNQDD